MPALPPSTLHRQPAVANRLVVGFDDLEMFFEDADVEHVRLDSGPTDRADVLTVRLPGMTLDVGTYSWRIISRGSTSGRHTTFITSERTSGTRFNGTPADLGIVHAYGPNSEFVGTGPGGTAFSVLSIETGELEAAARILGCDSASMPPGEVATYGGPAAERLQQLTTSFTRWIHRSGSDRIDAPAARQFHDEALIASLDVVGRDASNAERIRMSRRTALTIVTACDDFAARRRYQTVTALDLSRVAGYSDRRVRYAFKEITARSPMQYMRTRALNEIRRELRSGDATSVTDTAFAWGFTEMGRFARDYRHLFAELPSDTLRDARSRRTEPATELPG